MGRDRDSWRDAIVPDVQGPAVERRSPWTRGLPVVLEVLGVLGVAAAAAFLRFGSTYLISPDLKEVCADHAYRRPRRLNVPLEITDWLIAVLCILGLPLVVLLLELVRAGADRHKDAEGHGIWLAFKTFSRFTLVYLLGLFLVSATSDFLKMIFSRPRPYFLAERPGICRADAGGRTDEDVVAHLSFPSHRCAVLAYAGVVAAVHGDLALRGVRGVFVLRAILATLALAPAALISTRVLAVRDNHWEDVIGGLALGTILAFYVELALLRGSERYCKRPEPRADWLCPNVTLPRPRIFTTPSVEAINGLGLGGVHGHLRLNRPRRERERERAPGLLQSDDALY